MILFSNKWHDLPTGMMVMVVGIKHAWMGALTYNEMTLFYISVLEKPVSKYIRETNMLYETSKQ